MIPIKLPREQKEQIMDSLIAFFEEERSETLGQLSPNKLLISCFARSHPMYITKRLKMPDRSSFRRVCRLKKSFML